MEENKMLDLENILSKFEKIVSPNFCENLAIRTKLVQRATSRLKGYEFAQSMMIPNGFLEAETLNSLAVRMQKINKSCSLSASALAQRINTTSAEAFMRACFAKVLKEIVKQELSVLSDLEILSFFNRVLIQDSTKAELNEKLAPHFKGIGGLASKASVKLDYIFDYVSEQFIDIKFVPGSIPDQSLGARIVPFLQPNDLVIRDLGYYALNRIQEVEENKAYYISRLKCDILVYESREATEPLDLAKYLDKRAHQGIIDFEVFIGKKERQPVRLVACLLDSQAINKRQRGANKSSKRSGSKISKKKSNLLRYCLFITNISRELLPGTSVMAIYRARWRIELIFKQWKSCLKLHFFKGYNKERFHCFLYGRLIMILLLSSLYPSLIKLAQSINKELSCYKLTKYLVADNALFLAIHNKNINQFIDQLLEDIPRRLCMDKRNRESLRSNVKKGNCYYNPSKSAKFYENIS